MCGSPVDKIHFEGRERFVCPACGHVHYINPIPATTLAAVRDGHVLLVLRGIEPHRGEWCLPGGFLEWGERPEEGASREFTEETGLVAERLRFVSAFNSYGVNHVILLGFQVEEWSGDLIAGDDAEDARWFPLNDRPKLAFKAHEAVLAAVLDKTEEQ